MQSWKNISTVHIHAATQSFQEWGDGRLLCFEVDFAWLPFPLPHLQAVLGWAYQVTLVNYMIDGSIKVK